MPRAYTARGVGSPSPTHSQECRQRFCQGVLAVRSLQGVTRGCRLSWLTNSVLVYERGIGRVAGAQINFGDVTPYLTYGSVYYGTSQMNIQPGVQQSNLQRGWQLDLQIGA